MSEQTRDEAMRARIAAIDDATKALAALREVADVGRIFNAEMAATVARAAEVLGNTLKTPPPMRIGDMAFRKEVLIVDLWYPRLNYGPGRPPRTPDHPIAVEVGLSDVRSADSLLIEYDFDRDGFTIKQASIFSWAADDEKCDPDWQEVAFVQAWGRERPEEHELSPGEKQRMGIKEAQAAEPIPDTERNT